MARASHPRAASVVGETTHIAGNLHSDGDVRIEGCVDGDVHGRKVMVGANGRVLGRIVADEACISGSVRGGIAAQSVELTGSAKVTCGIVQERLTVEAGALVAGLIERPDARAPRPGRAADQEIVLIERVIWTCRNADRWMPLEA